MSTPRRNRRFLTVFFLAVFAAAVPSAAGKEDWHQKAQEIVDRAIDHHGGDLYGSSEVALTVASRSGEFDLWVKTHGDLFDHRVTRVADGAEEVVRVTHDGVTRTRGGELAPVAPEEEQRLRDYVSARVYFPFLPYRLNDPSVRKEYLGLEEWNEKKLHKVKVTFAEGSSTDAEDEYLYWFDPETFQLEQLAYSFATGYGGLRFRKGKNYRRVGGMLFFDADNYGVNGKQWRVGQITPAFVEEQMELISTVELQGISVEGVE